MHFRGKAMELWAELPDGSRVDICKVPKYDFNWQQNYEFANQTEFPKGTKILASAWFDNSPNNPNNPDPTATVRWGDQTSEEMFVAWTWFAFPVNAGR
jgi:hypothetical protein